VVAAAFLATVVSAVTEQECLDTYLPARIACYDTEGPCDALPIPDFAFPNIDAGESGYAIQVLRSSEYTHVYHVTEFAYNFLVVLDMPDGAAYHRGDEDSASIDTESSSNDAGRRRLGNKIKKSKGGKGSKVKGSGSKKSSKTKKLTSKGGGGGRNTVSVAIIDMPTGSFELRNETGAVVGSLVTTAIDEILFDMEGFTVDDIGDVYMILSHNHMDHVGTASITLDHIETNWGVDDVSVVAADLVAETYERLIELGLFSYRAPIPNVLISDKTTLYVGRNTAISLDPASGHSLDHQDLIVFLEKDGDGNPAILMFVDVVFPKWAPFSEFALTTDLAEFVAIHDTLLGYPLGDDGIFVGGHLNQGKSGQGHSQVFVWLYCSSRTRVLPNHLLRFSSRRPH